LCQLRLRLCIFYEKSEQTAGETGDVDGRIKLKYICEEGALSRIHGLLARLPVLFLVVYVVMPSVLFSWKA
jgi:hypothetical protein